MNTLHTPTKKIVFRHPSETPCVTGLMDVKPRIALYEVIIPEIIYFNGERTWDVKNARHICIADSFFTAYRQAEKAFSNQPVHRIPEIGSCTIIILGDI